MAIARYPGFVLDCSDPAALASFYADVLDWQVKAEEGRAEIRPEGGGDRISFQGVADYRAPEWPGQR